jgi:hypothetical protein
MSTEPRRVLVIANETVESDLLRGVIARRVGASGSSVLVVAPALNSRLAHWSSSSTPPTAASSSPHEGRRRAP